MKNSRGFTFIELMLGLSLLALIFALTAPFALQFYLDYRIVSEARTLESILRTARTAAMTNENGAAHGLYVDADNFVLFEGDSYATRVSAQDQLFPRAVNVAVAGFSELTFEQLSGRTSSTTITLTEGGRIQTLHINAEGRIQ